VVETIPSEDISKFNFAEFANIDFLLSSILSPISPSDCFFFNKESKFTKQNRRKISGEYILQKLSKLTNPGITNKNIESPKFLHRPLHKQFPRFWLAHIAFYFN
jgi:hypothetical protein